MSYSNPHDPWETDPSPSLTRGKWVTHMSYLRWLDSWRALASDESDQPLWRSSLSGSEDEGYRGQSDIEVEEEEVEDWYDVDQPNIPNTHCYRCPHIGMYFRIRYFHSP